MEAIACGTLRSCTSGRAPFVIGRVVVRFRHVASARAEPAFAMLEFDVLFVIDGLRHRVECVKIVLQAGML